MTDIELKTPDGHPLQGGYRVVACAVCGCGYADVLVPSSYYEAYYGALAKYGNEAAVYDDSTEQNQSPEDPPWLAAKADDSARRIDDLLSSKQARVLDVGCGTGHLLAGIGRLGYERLHGVDPSPQAVQLARARAGIEAEVGSFASLPPGLGTFDCVCVTGVFEHLWDVDAAVKTFHPLLRPGGLIYVEVPDASRYLDPYVSPYEDFNTEHVNHFSAPTLRTLAARLGLETVQETRYESSLTMTVTTGALAVAWVPGGSGAVEHGRDEELANSLRDFAQRSADDLHALEGSLAEDLEGNSSFVLWGVGEAAFKLLPLPPIASRQAIAYVDSNASRQAFRFDGTPVTTPTDIVSGPVPIVASSLIRADSIVDAVRELGLENPVVRVDRWGRLSGSAKP